MCYNKPMRGTAIIAPWSKEMRSLLKELETSASGLSHHEAVLRSKRFGYNELQKEKNTHGAIIFARQFKSPLTLILIFASLIAHFLGDTAEVMMIMTMVLMSSILAFIQEYRSEKALRALRKKLTHYATVIRQGKPVTIDARELVIGDVVDLELGNVAPADLRIIQTEDLEMDESILTGESVPVSKSVLLVNKKRPTPQEQVNMIFMGTHVVQGAGRGLVVAVGQDTEMGKTAALLNEKPEETDFQKGVRDFSRFILKVTIGLIILAGIGIGLLRGDWIEAVLFALALAVGLSPELFPMIVTVNLSRGAMKMSQKNVLVKRLISIEDLGNADVFCTDKTGTLTVGKIRVRESVDPFGKNNNLPLAYASRCLAYDAKGRTENSIDQAIEEAASGKRIKPVLSGATRIDIVSFDFMRRRMSCVIGHKGNGRELIVKGAVKEVLEACRSVKQDEGSAHDLQKHERHEITKLTDGYQDQGYRVIAVARRIIGLQDAYSPADEKDLELIGFVLMSDAPKQTSRAALLALRKLNVKITILTGDSERITRHVARQLNFDITGLMDGGHLAKLDEAQLGKAVEENNVFTGISPGQKLQIIKALKKNGHTVGFMGDGVNDAPSLRAADVGLSFENAIDVAKEAASVIMLKKNLSVLADGIREGRRTFANTQTYINTTISSNFGNMLSLAGVSFFLPFVPMLPAQILLLNLLSDFPMMGISIDRVADEDLASPKHWDISHISNYMYFFGIISSLADYTTFGLLFYVAHADIALFRSGWFVESLITEVIVIFLLRTRKTTASNLPSRTLMILCAIAIATAFAITQTGLGVDFEFVPLSLKIIFYILAIVAGYALLVEAGKRAFFRFIERTA